MYTAAGVAQEHGRPELSTHAPTPPHFSRIAAALASAHGSGHMAFGPRSTAKLPFDFNHLPTSCKGYSSRVRSGRSPSISSHGCCHNQSADSVDKPQPVLDRSSKNGAAQKGRSLATVSSKAHETMRHSDRQRHKVESWNIRCMIENLIAPTPSLPIARSVLRHVVPSLEPSRQPALRLGCLLPNRLVKFIHRRV